MSVEISVKKIILDGGSVRFDLTGKNLPENFLGMAGDLKFANWGEGLKYEKMEWGNAFAGFAPGDLPVKMVKNEVVGTDEGKIIFGISLKADNLKNLHDGVIGSFYFSGKGVADLQFEGFQHAVFSTYENGRVDSTDVKWLNAGQIKMPTEIIAGPVQSIDTPITPEAAQPIETPEVKKNFKNQEAKGQNGGTIEANSRAPTSVSSSIPTLDANGMLNLDPNGMLNLDEAGQNNFTSTTPTDLSSMDMTRGNSLRPLSDNQFFWWILPALIGLLILLLGSWLYWRKRVANKTWQYSPA